MRIESITPATMICNEEFWCYYSIRDMLKVFPKIIVLDTGSTDRTVEIIKEAFPMDRVQLIEENYNGKDTLIGNGRNVLRELCPTEWMLLWDGDEIWREAQLRRMLEFEIEPTAEIIMVTGWNVQDVDGKLKLRTHDRANRDGLFSKNIRWYRTDYPYESYGLHDTHLPQGKVQYLPSMEVYAYHMRHTLRSSKNWETFFRKDKINFYPYGHLPEQTFEDMPADWIGEIDPRFPNPYLL